METLFEHPHLLDGALGRAAAYLALAIVIGLTLWEFRLKATLNYQHAFRWSALILGLFGLVIAINSTVLEANDPFGVKVMALPDLATVLELLQRTNFGKAWLAYTGFLMLGLCCNRLALRILAITGMTAALVMSSHAGEEGILKLAFWIDYLHLLMALTWLGGLTVLIALRLINIQGLSKKQDIDTIELKFFSRIALPVFILILASGALQAVLKLIQEGTLSIGYIAVLSMKVLIVLAVMASAWTLRRYLKHGNFVATRFDNGLSLEYFFALVLILTTGLLTQIPPS